MSLIDRIFGRLNRVFSRDPKIQPVVAITRDAAYSNLVATDGNTYGLNIISNSDGSFLPTFERMDAPPAGPTVIASAGNYYQLNITDNGDETFSYSYTKLPGSGSFGLAVLDGVDGYRYQLNIIDNGDGTFSDTCTRIAGTAGVICPAILSISSLSLAIQADTQTLIDLSTATVSELVAAINGLTGFNAELTAADSGPLLARGLYEVSGQDLAQDQNLYFPTALLYNEIQTYAWTLGDQADRLKSAEAQLYMDTAEDDWLDYWGSFFKNPRYPNEADPTYAQRIANQIIQASQNNVALEIIIKRALGVDVDVVDAVSILDQLSTEDQANAVGRFVLDNLGISNDWLTGQQEQVIDQVLDIVNRYRAAGTGILLHLITMLSQHIEEITISETLMTTIMLAFNDALVAGPVRAGAGWRAGTPGLKAGNNSPIMEQAYVQVISTTDGSLIGAYLYGG